MFVVILIFLQSISAEFFGGIFAFRDQFMICYDMICYALYDMIGTHPLY